jgi:hypothetical protein
MTDEQRHLRDDSDSLLTALDQMKQMEQDKRDMEISSDEFHELADAIEDQSREVFRIAADERVVGERSPKTGATANSVRPSIDGSVARGDLSPAREPTAAD